MKSKDFLTDDWQIITLERLFYSFFGESLYRAVFAIREVEERYLFLVHQVERITGLTDFGKYLNKLFTIDAMFLNEDRHMHNIAVLMNSKGEFAYCPIFDNGGGPLSDTTMDYPMGGEVYTKKDISQLLEQASIYSEVQRRRVETILFEQMRKYQYLFT